MNTSSAQSLINIGAKIYQKCSSAFIEIKVYKYVDNIDSNIDKITDPFAIIWSHK